MTKRLSMLVAVALLAGCSGITDVIQKRESLYGAVPVNAVAPAPAAYELAIAAARKGYSASLDVQSNSVEGLVDAGISAANSNCRAC
jgi:predicted aspartyl protease